MSRRKGQASLSAEARRHIVRRRQDGEPAAAIARDFDISARTVARLAAVAGRPRGRPPIPQEVRRRVADRVLRDGERCGEVARGEGLDRSTVWRITRKRRAAPGP